jgi:hypothetical protein
MRSHNPTSGRDFFAEPQLCNYISGVWAFDLCLRLTAGARFFLALAAGKTTASGVDDTTR